MSWFQDFVGGAAGAGADILKERQARDDRIAEQEAQEARRLKYMEQQEALQEKKMQVQEALKEARRKEAQARGAQERTDSEQAGMQIANQRDAKGLEVSNGPNMDADTAGMISKTQRKQYEEAGLIQPRTQLGMLDDAKQAARGMGYYDTAESIGKDRKVAYDDKVQADRLSIEDRRRDEIEKHNRAVEKASLMNANTNAASLAQAANRDVRREGESKKLQMVDNARKILLTAEKEARQSAEQKFGKPPEPLMATKEEISDYEFKVSSFIAGNKNVAGAQKELDRREAALVGDDSERKDSPKAWTPPKTVDRESVIKQAQEAISKGADPEKVKARMKQMGINF